MFSKLRADAALLVESVISLVYHMKGSIQYEDMMFRTPGERDAILSFLNKLEKDKERAYRAAKASRAG